MEQLLEYVDPNLIVLIPVAWVIGWVVKHMGIIKDSYVSGVMVVVAATLGLLWTAWHRGDIGSIWGCIFIGSTQGIICAGVAIIGKRVVSKRKK